MKGIVFLRPALLVLLLLAPAAWLAWRRWPPPMAGRQSRFVLAFRLVVIVLLVLAVAGLRATRQPDARAIIAVVDLSDSAQDSLEDAAGAVRSLARAKGPDDMFGVVTFGRDAQVEVSPSRRPLFEGFQTRPDPTYSDLGGALELAANLVPENFGRQLVLVSDGRQNLGDAAAVVARLKNRAVRVDVLAIGEEPAAEALVVGLDAPGQLREGQTLTATARLRSATSATGTLSLQIDGQEVATTDITTPAGDSSHDFTLAPLPPGLHRMRAVLDVAPDARSQNNVAEAVVRVLGQPSVLVLEGAPQSGDNIISALEAAGMRVEKRRSEDTPTDPSALAAYDSIVVADAPADAFPDKGLPAIAAAVSDLGRGLVALGGPTAYGPGGWQGTSLEKALPVRMELPRRKQKPSLAVVVVMETMEYPEGDRVALGALESVLDQLGPEDEIGVVHMHREGSYFSAPLTRMVDKKAIIDQILTAELGDPPGYGESMQMGIDALATSTAATKHMVVLGDGDAVADIANYPAIFSGGPDVTVSVVGVDTHDGVAYMQHMRDMAKLGGGRFYQSDDATDVPEILLKASKAALRPWFEQEPFFPKVTSAGDLLEGVPIDAFPQLGGYVVTTPKGAADVSFTSAKGDPVLAGWNYGLGRSVAWTSDVRGRWTTDLLNSPAGPILLARMVAWSLPGGPVEGLTVEAVPAGDGLDVTVTGAERGGEVELTALGPDLSKSVVQLRGTEPGQWQGRVPAPALGTYVLRAQLQRGGTASGQAEALISVPYSPEYLELGRDDGLLRQVARQGGMLLRAAPVAWDQKLPPLAVTSDLFMLLLLTAVILWPLEVAARRLNLGPTGLLGLLRAIVTFRRPKDVEVVVPESLSRLKERLQTHRRSDGADGHPEDAPPAAADAPATTDVAPVAPVAPKPPIPPKPKPPKQGTEAGDDSPSARLLAAKRRREEEGGK